MPYAVEENLRGMTERKKERKNERIKDRDSGFLLYIKITLTRPNNSGGRGY